MTNLNQRRVKFGPFQADLVTLELWRHGLRVRLGGQPFQILLALLEEPGRLVTREELRKRIWAADTFVDFNHGLNAAVNKLREALCDSPEQPRYIETLPRRGYRFIAKVDEVAHETRIVAPAEHPSALSVEIPAPPPPLSSVCAPPFSPPAFEISPPAARTSLVRLLALAAPLALIAVGAAGFYWARWFPASPSAEESELRLKQDAENHVGTDMENLRKRTAETAPGGGVTIHYVPQVPENTALPASREEHRNEEALPSSQRVPVLLPAERAGQTQKTVLTPARSSNTFLLHIQQAGQALGLFPEEQSPSRQPSILRVDLRHPGSPSPGAPSRVITGWDAIAGPQPSPDGKRLVFMAGQTNSMEIWISNIDGSSPRKLTDLASAGTPRWSPDSRWIAFDSDGRFGHSAIYVVSAEDGTVRPVVQDDANNSVPSWSRDGRFIYFASNRGGPHEAEQVWKVPLAGGEPVQLTRHGGFSAFESADGQTLYYAKHRYQNPEIWQVPANGGEEARVSLVHPTTWASWAVTNSGILLLSEYNTTASQLQYLDFASRSVRMLATLEKASFWLAASPDGSAVWYSELTDTQARQVFTASMD